MATWLRKPGRNLGSKLVPFFGPNFGPALFKFKLTLPKSGSNFGLVLEAVFWHPDPHFLQPSAVLSAAFPWTFQGSAKTAQATTCATQLRRQAPKASTSKARLSNTANTHHTGTKSQMSKIEISPDAATGQPQPCLGTGRMHGHQTVRIILKGTRPIRQHSAHVSGMRRNRPMPRLGQMGM